MTTPAEFLERAALARQLLSAGRTPYDDLKVLDDVTLAALPAKAGLAADLGIPFPAGLAPVPQPIVPPPAPGARLPRADVVVVTWTVAEQDAMCDVLTPGYNRQRWYRYDRNFAAYANQIRDGAPSKNASRLGSYFPVRIGGKSVLCMKSELHLNQDGVRTGPGKATLPVKDFFLQIIAEAQPQVILTVGTCGGIDVRHDLGDVLVTRGARFRLQSEFASEDFANAPYKSDWPLPTTHFATAEALMARFATRLREPAFGPPTKRFNFPGPLLEPQPNTPSIVHERGAGANKLDDFHPILTTDFFEFGTSANAAELLRDGCGLEMGDAALGLAVYSLPEANRPKWAVIRNISDPQINADLPKGAGALNMQTHWAVWYYEAFGYWTSVNSALATWGVIAGL